MASSAQLEPKQRRSRETRERICDAMLELLREQSYHATSVEEIVERAECSTSSFYSRFPSKLALLEFLQERAVRDGEFAMAPLAAVTAETYDSPADLGRAILREYMAYRRRHRGLLRATRSLEANEPSVRQRRERLDRSVFATIKGAILRCVDAEPGGWTERQLDRTMWIFPAAARAVMEGPHHGGDGSADPIALSEAAVDVLAGTAIPALLEAAAEEERAEHDGEFFVFPPLLGGRHSTPT